MALTIRAPGAELMVDVSGTGAPLLFIHGFPFDRTMWRHQLRALGAWQCVAPDLRGAGQSSVPSPADPAAYSMTSYADDLVALLDALDIDAAAVCGLSMGGYILFELLRRYPRRIRAAVFCNTKADADTPEARRGRDELAALAEREGAAAVAARLLPMLLAPATVNQRPDVVQEVRGMMARAPAQGIVGALRALRDRPDSTPTLGTIAVPTLVIAGTEDRVTPAQGMRQMAAAIAGARFTVIDDAGHLAPLEQPARLSDALRKFLDGLA